MLYIETIIEHSHYTAGVAKGHWEAHERAVIAPRHGTTEEAIVLMLRGWLVYADAYRTYSGEGEERRLLSEDYVLGPLWASIGVEIIKLMDGDTGWLDPGSIDGIIRRTLEAEGFDPDQL